MGTGIAPWLAVPDGAAAVDFYDRALGAVLLYRLDGDGETVEVAQFAVAEARFWIQQDPGNSPEQGGAAPVRMIVTVDDPDSWYARATAAGATEVAAVHEEYGWRTGRVRDPFGHDWEFSRQTG